jgi:hypothetical protein
VGFFQGIVSMFIEKLANRVADEVILFLRKRMRLAELDKEAKDLKSELDGAASSAEREAVLDKIHDLINNIGSV